MSVISQERANDQAEDHVVLEEIGLSVLEVVSMIQPDPTAINHAVL